MYPTIEEVNKADHETLARWYRFLPSPGSSAINSDDREKFQKAIDREKLILDRITERLKELGGMTPEISKRVGW